MSMRHEVPTAVIITDGSNCQHEMLHSFKKAGADARLVHINELRNKEVSLRDFRMVGYPGGFTDGDAVRSGKILAVELIQFFGDQFHDFSERDGGIGIGICNGFQTLVRAGILPKAEIGNMHATLQHNDSGHFQCDWVHVTVEREHACVFLQGYEGTLQLPIAHGEGKFNALPEDLQYIADNQLVVARYSLPDGSRANGERPWNPNGSIDDISAITDISGHWFGSMPHYERVHDGYRNPNWRRASDLGADGIEIFKRMVEYFE